MQTPPYAYVQQLPPPPPMPPEERARRIAALANGTLLAKLAPLVDRLAGGSGPSPILRAPPAPGWVPLRLDTRKALAFDDGARPPFAFALVILFFAGWNAVASFVAFATKGKWQALAIGVVASIIAIAGPVACALAVVTGVRQLKATMTKCTVVPGRISAATPHVSPKGSSTGIDVTVDYGYAGAWRRAVKIVDREVYTLLGPTPEILVDTTNPDHIFFKDLYV